jgi:hypothetical protein
MADEQGQGEQPIEVASDHWVNSSTNEKLTTPEAKQFLSRYKTPDDAHIALIEARKTISKKTEGVIPRPAKDAKPEDVQAFQSGLRKELGAVDKVEGLKDLNWTVGLPEGSKGNDEVISAVSQFAVEKQIPKSVLQDMIGFNNQMAVQMAAAKEQADIDQIKSVQEGLIKARGGEKKVAEDSELVKRMFAKSVPPEQFEQVGQELVKSGMTKNPVLLNALMNMAQSYKEGATHEGEGEGKRDDGVKTIENNIEDLLPNTAKAIGAKNRK